MQVQTRVLDPDEWQVWRDIRLRSLADEPDAFGSTLELEQSFVEEDWRRRLVSPSVVSFADGTPIACGAIFQTKPGYATVVAMWVHPDHRGRGLSRQILDVLVGWARERGLTVEIGVNQANPVARAVYERYGFVPTRHSYPLRDGSRQLCDVMELPATRG